MAPAEEVLIDAQHLRTRRTGSLCRHAAQIVPEPALYGGAGDPLPFRQSAAADAVKVFLADAAAKRLTGAQPRQNPRETLPEAASTGKTMPLPRLQFQNAVPDAPALMP